MEAFQTGLASIAASASARVELEESLGSTFLQRLAPGELVAARPAPATAHAPHAASARPAATDPAAAASAAAPVLAPAAPASAALPTQGGAQPAAPAASNLATRPAARPAPAAHAKQGASGAIRAPQLSGPQERLNAIAPVCTEAMGCSRCTLCEHRRQVIFGDGALDADLVFIANAPGRVEDETGTPFSGNDGEFFTTILEKGLQRPRASVFLTSVVKCRPELGREPREEEYQACLPYLQQQLHIIRPKALVVFGEAATHALCGGRESMAQLRGLWLEFMGIPLLPVYEISEVYRHRRNLGRNNAYERQFWQDLQTVLPRLTPPAP